MKELQTPRKDLSHRRLPKDSPSSKSISDQSKKSQKIAKKSLNAEFSSVSEGFVSESLTESFNFSHASEILTDNHNEESLESFESLIAADNYSLSALEEALTPSASNSSSTITTVNEESNDLPVDQCKAFGSDESAEAEVAVVANLLKQARIQVLNSNDVHPGSKKLLDALVEVSVKEFYALPFERDRIDVLIAERFRVLILCFMACLLISMLVIVFNRGSGAQSSYSYYPPPT